MSRNYFSPRFFILIVAAFCLLSIVDHSSGDSESSYEGKSLQDALQELQRRGLNILYSSDLVHPEMKVVREPLSGSPRKMLDDLLSAHGLKTDRGPRNTLLVVRGKQEHSSMLTETIDSKQVTAYLVVPFVSVYMTAQDSDKNFVSDLRPEHFVLKEDGREQPILDFISFGQPGDSLQNIPLTVFFVIDSSQSTTFAAEGMKSFDLFKRAALMLLDRFQPNDQMMVTGFNVNSWTVSPMTQDLETSRQRMEEMKVAGGKTAVFDAMIKVLDQLDEYSGRKIIVLFSDGQDNSSSAKLNDLLGALKSSDATLFAIGIDTHDSLSKKGREVLEKITEVTSGYPFFPTSLNDLNTLTAQIHEAIESQYAAGYIPPQPSIHKWREVEIKCKIPGIHLRYRKTYLF